MHNPNDGRGAGGDDPPTEIIHAARVRGYVQTTPCNDITGDREWPPTWLHPDTAVIMYRVTGLGQRPAYVLDLTEPGCAPVRYVLTADLALRLASQLVKTLR